MDSYNIFVSPSASGCGDGSEGSPMTFAAAKAKLESLCGGAVTLWLKGGRYYLDNTAVFSQNTWDSLIIKSCPGKKAVFTSGRLITGWSETQVNGVRAFTADVDFSFNTLYSASRRLRRSRFPKSGELTIKGFNEADIHKGSGSIFSLNTSFYAEPGDILPFKNVCGVFVRVLHYWHDELLPLASVDADNDEVKTAKAASMTMDKGDRYFFENVFEALCEPGEWCIDSKAGKVWYIPEEGETADGLVLYAPVLEELFRFDSVRNVTVSDVAFECTDFIIRDGTFQPDADKPFPDYCKFTADFPQAAFDIFRAVEVSKSENVIFDSCKFERIGASALGFGAGSRNCSAVSCEFSDIGGNGVYISGGNFVDNSQKVTEKISVTGCLVDGYGREFNNAIGVMLTFARKCTISRNEIRDGFYTAISVGWTWGYSDNVTGENLIENNLIYNIGQGWLSDMGGIYTLGIQEGTVLRGNLIHDVGCYGGESGYGGWGIYLDEGSTHILVENNLCCNCSSQGFHQHYGRENMIINNIFALNGDGQLRVSRKEEHCSLFLYHNIFLSDNAPMFCSLREEQFADRENMFWDITRHEVVVSIERDKLSSCEAEHIFDKTKAEEMGCYSGAVFADPMFTDPENGDFTLKEDSPAAKAGFTPWNFSGAGR